MIQKLFSNCEWSSYLSYLSNGSLYLKKTYILLHPKEEFAQ